MKIALTGHRPGRLRGKDKEIYDWIVEKLAEYNCDEAICGMARGADMIFARAAVNMKIPVDCYFAYKKKRFSSDEKEVINHSKNVKFFADEYDSNNVYFIRDDAMAKDCDLLLAVFDGGRYGGTWYTIKSALMDGKTVLVCPVFPNGQRAVNSFIECGMPNIDPIWDRIDIPMPF